MTKLIMAFAMLLAIIAGAGCTNPEDAHRALSAQGFTNVRITGYDWWACGEDDFYHTAFVATNPQGLEVSGVVCSGLLFKNATIKVLT